MGIDLFLGALVVIAALRGWFRGFLLQAIGLGSLVGSVYLAEPARDLARPYVAEYLPNVGSNLDKLLWWASAVACYVVLAGVGTWIVKAQRRRSILDLEPSRSDQGAGFLLGAAKGLVLAAFLASGVTDFATKYIQDGSWVDEQRRASYALDWSEQYRPARRIWESPPVQSFVAHVRRHGLGADPATSAKPDTARENEADPPKPAAPAPVRTANRATTLALPPAELDPRSSSFLRDLDERLEREGLGKSR